MNALYDEVKAVLDPPRRVLHVSARLRNDSPQPWRAADGFRVGWQITDAESGTLVADGDRIAPPGDVAPGETMRVDFSVPLPPDPGQYHVTVSPMREGECWYRDRGWWFLLVEAALTEDRLKVKRPRIVTLGRLRADRRLRSVGRSFTYPVLTAWRNRALIRTMVRRDILGRYRGSFGGAFWTIINPLLL